MKEHSKYFYCLKNLLPMCVSKDCLDSNLTEDDLVRKEAILNCSGHKWSSFLCILGLSSVFGTNIFTYYPDCGELRYKLLFNRLIKPRQHNHSIDLDAIHLLFCFEGRVEPGKTFQPNHFVPLLFYPHQLKRKSSAGSYGSTSKKLKEARISDFFTVTGKSTNNLISQKTPNESLALAPQPKSGSTNPSISGSQAETPASQVANITSQVTNVSQFDIALYRDKVKGMDTSSVCTLIKNVFKPTKEYCFPKRNGRSFRYDWLNLYRWLCYSSSKDGAYCLSCALFGDRFPAKAGRISRLFFNRSAIGVMLLLH